MFTCLQFMRYNINKVSKGVYGMAIKIYTDYITFEKKQILLDNDSFFKINVVAKDFGYTEASVMMEVDGAVLINKELGTVETSKGVTSIDNLSTGCKTILNYLFVLKNPKYNEKIKAIDVSSCGVNALETLFKVMEKLEKLGEKQIALILKHKDNLNGCQKRTYIINDTEKIEDLLYMV